MEGRVVSHFRVLEKLGGGGMGVVYRAQDTRLGREVALKFLPEHLTRDPITLERFRREARAASALDHPNICQVLDIGEDEAGPFIVLELLKGRTLMPRRGEDPLPLETMLDLAIQIASALAAAHESGIVHRDVKPSNIFVTERGQAKVLDFGLAKVGEGARAGSPALSSGTEEVTSPWTSPGTVLGTVAYMSPEQARGEALDARTDLFSFGAMLFEMATGRPAFEGDTAASVFAAILNKKAAPPSGINPEVPAELDRIVLKALEKDREVRYQSAKELLADLKRLKRDTTSGTAAGGGEAASHPPASSVKSGRRLLVGGGLAAGLGLALLILFRPPPPVPRVKDYVQITSDRVEKFGPWFEGGPMTDGSRVYFNDFGNSGFSRISYVAASGGEVVSLPAFSPYYPLLVDVSRDGADLLVVVFDTGWMQSGERLGRPRRGGKAPPGGRPARQLRGLVARRKANGLHERPRSPRRRRRWLGLAEGLDGPRLSALPGLVPRRPSAKTERQGGGLRDPEVHPMGSADGEARATSAPAALRLSRVLRALDG
jgi:serine/threonine protein kinase